MAYSVTAKDIARRPGSVCSNCNFQRMNFNFSCLMLQFAGGNWFDSEDLNFFEEFGSKRSFKLKVPLRRFQESFGET